MSADPQASVGSDQSGKASVQDAIEQASQLALLSLTPEEFYAEFLKLVLQVLTAPCGTVWIRSEETHFLEVCRANPGHVDRELDPEDQKQHEALLWQAIQQAQPLFQPPSKNGKTSDPAGAAVTHFADWLVLLVPFRHNRRVEGLVEVWHKPAHEPLTVETMIRKVERLADQIGVYLLQRQKVEQLPTEQLHLDQLDGFLERVHGSLHPTEVAYLIANEGRQLIGCDRLSVALRRGRKVSIESISGAESVDQRSILVRRLRQLCKDVLRWDEKLVYRGVPDPSLPPEVLRDLDAYLEASRSKFLVVLPLKDERECKRNQPARSALVMECFQTTVPPEQLTARLETIARKTTRAIYNASAYRDIPLKLLWLPLAKIQEGLGGKTKAIVYSVAAALVVLLLVLCFVPYPLKVDANGQLLPKQRRWLFTPVEGQVIRIEQGVETGSFVAENQSLILMYDINLETKLSQLAQEHSAAQNDVTALIKQIAAATTEQDRLRLSAEKLQKEALRARKGWEVRTLRERTHSDDSRPGYFWLKAPIGGTVLSWDARERLTNSQVKPSEPLLRIGDKDRGWEVELKIPQKHMGQIVEAFKDKEAGSELDVDLLVISSPTRTYKGKLSRARLAGEASPNKDETGGESEPVVLVSIRIDGPAIAVEERIPPDLLLTGTEVHGMVRCGNHVMGYSLFYGVWEFIYEKVIFFF